MGHIAHPLQPAVQAALSYAGHVALAALVQLALVLGTPLVLAALMQPVARWSERWTEQLVGRRSAWVAVGCVATALHEGGHAAFALLFRHEVTRVKWFDFEARDGSLGRVDHRYDPTSAYQRVGRFFIGLGPVVVGALVLWIAARLLLGTHAAASSAAAPAHTPSTLDATARALAAQLGASVRDVGRLVAALAPGRWQTWVFLYAAYVAGSAMRLSSSDLRSVGAGLWTVGCLLLLVDALTLWAGPLATSGAMAVARALELCNAALVAAIALQALGGGMALVLTHGVRALTARRAAPASG